MQINTVHSTDNAKVVFKLSGELDHHCAAKLTAFMDREISSCGSEIAVIMDFSGVSFMDSSGLGVIIGRYKLIKKKGGVLYIANPNKNIERLLRMSGIYALAKSI